MSRTVEIERKYLLDRLPVIPPGAEVWRIEQGYLPDQGGRLRRVQLANGRTLCTHTVKTGTGMVRHETERSISPQEFERQWPGTLGRRLTKTRHRVRDRHSIWEIDAFADINLALAEIELASPEESVSIPEWLAARIVREVTDDPAYTNASIAARIGGLAGQSS